MSDTILILAGGILALGAVILLILRSNAPKEQKAPPSPATPSRERAPDRETPVRPVAAAGGDVMAREPLDRFRGGMIFPQPDPCAPVTLLRGKTFPEGRIPGIPVGGCDRGGCDCQVHTVVGRRRGSRRMDPDRRDDLRINEDRRSGQDRRSA